MKSHKRVIRVALLCITVSACAHPGRGPAEQVSTADVAADVVIPPKMMPVIGTLQLRSRGGPMHGKVEVPVDAFGRPDVSGIRFTGSFDDLTRRDLADYIGQQTFMPAKRNGVPSPGVFEMTFR